jgi:lysylphosphatidylglycerol synthetase-like protein (DUF2156 family)
VTAPLATARPAAAGAWLVDGVRRTPVTVTLVLLLTTTLVTGLPPAGPPGVAAGVGRPVWTLLLSGVRTADAVAYVAVATLVVGLVGPVERRLGSRATLVGLVAGQVVGTATGLAAIAVLRGTGDVWARELAATAVVGPLPGVLALAGFASMRMSAPWRRRLRLSVSIGLGALLLYSGTTGDVFRLSGWLVGLAVGSLAARPEEPRTAVHPSRREGRALVALLVAVTALGPLVAAVSRTPDGPWSVLSHLFVSAPPSPGVLRAVCGPGGDLADCRVLEARARLTGHGPALLSVLPVLLQLVFAEGLRRGRRAAWVGAVAFSTVLTAVGAAIVVLVLRTPADSLELLAARPRSLPAVSVAAPLVAPLAVLVVLLVTGRRFGVRAAPGSVRRWTLTAAAALALLAFGYVVIGSAGRSGWAGHPSPAGLLADLPRRMLPPGYLGEVRMPLAARDEGTRLLAGWTGVAAWTVLLVTAVRLIRPVAPTGDAADARALVERHGDGPLSFMTTWVGNRYWFPPDGSAVVAYRVIGGVALTTGDPVGPRDARLRAVQAFTGWCEERGWTPCWYSVTDDVADALTRSRAQRLQVAAETWLPLGDLAFRGRRWQDVRTALSRAAREGVEARWTRWADAPLALRDQVVRLSEDWLARKGLPEMGFTLGGLDELDDPDVRCLLAMDGAGRLHGLTSWLPARRDGATIGWTLDVMRRATDAAPGTMEFLIATAALTFQDEGCEWVSLSGAPLALPGGAGDRGMLTRLLELAGRTMEPVYGFRSLLAFKAKFSPCYRPLWLLYQEPADLPRIARAVSGAYLPHLSVPAAVRLGHAVITGRRAARPPAAPPVPGPTAARAG